MKSFSVKSGFGIGAVILAVAAIIALPVRTVQFFTVLEGGTGFFTSNDWSVYVLYIVLAAAILAFLVLGISKRKKLDFSREATKRPAFGIASLIAAAGIFYDGLSCAFRVVNNNQPIIDYDYAGTPTLNSEKVIFSVEALFAVLTAIFLLSLGISAVSGKTNGSEHRLISLSPVIWCIIRMVYRFTRTISYQRVSDLTFELLMLVFLAMFFMAFAQVNAQIGGKNCEWKLAGYGLPAALLALVCFIPRFIVTITGQTELLYSYSPAEFCDLTAALFVIATVFTRVTDRVEAEVTEEPEEISEESPVKE